jgi:hypothetical protein
LKYILLALLFIGCNKDILEIESSEYTPVPFEPKSNSSWHIEIKNKELAEKEVDLYIIDLLSGEPQTKVNTVAVGDTKVVCKLSAGTYDSQIERLYPVENHPYPEVAVGNIQTNGSTYWVDITSDYVREIMKGRIEFASRVGCDGILFTEVSSYDQNTGFQITEDDQIEFNRYLSGKAHEFGVFAGFSDIEAQIYSHSQFADLVFVQNCFQRGTCKKYEDFSENGATLNLETVPYNASGNIDTNLTNLCLHSKAFDIESRIFNGIQILNPMEECSEKIEN